MKPFPVNFAAELTKVVPSCEVGHLFSHQMGADMPKYSDSNYTDCAWALHVEVDRRCGLVSNEVWADVRQQGGVA